MKRPVLRGYRDDVTIANGDTLIFQDRQMASISMRQLLDHAAENDYGVPAFNVNNLAQIQAIMQTAEETSSPVIMQASAGARRYAGEPFEAFGTAGQAGKFKAIPLDTMADKYARGEIRAYAEAGGRSGGNQPGYAKQ